MIHRLEARAICVNEQVCLINWPVCAHKIKGMLFYDLQVIEPRTYKIKYFLKAVASQFSVNLPTIFHLSTSIRNMWMRPPERYLISLNFS